MFKSITCCIIVFMSGAVAALNLSWLKYGVPLHFIGGWGKFILACALAGGFSTLIIRKIHNK